MNHEILEDMSVTSGEEREAQLETFDAVIERGLADSDSGRGKPADQVLDRLEKKYSAMVDDRA